MSSAPTRPDCSRCRHYFVTWQTANPRACRAYGFRSTSWPSAVVLRESGTACTLFEARETTGNGARADDRSSLDRTGR